MRDKAEVWAMIFALTQQVRDADSESHRLDALGTLESLLNYAVRRKEPPKLSEAYAWLHEREAEFLARNYSQPHQVDWARGLPDMTLAVIDYVMSQQADPTGWSGAAQAQYEKIKAAFEKARRERGLGSREIVQQETLFPGPWWEKSS